MTELGEDLYFQLEMFARVLVADKALVQDFHGDFARPLQISRQIDAAHAPFRQKAERAVTAEKYPVTHAPHPDA
jgi:hypothetical protein